MIRFRNIALSVLCVGLVACVSDPGIPPDSARGAVPRVAQSAAIQQDTGEDVARHLTNRYADVASNCEVDSQPAFLCNGVKIRGTSYKEGRHAWDNSPANHTSGGVSFSYLRKDSVYRKLAYGYSNGYIFEAYKFADGKIHPEVFCSFPIDAGTSERADHGCGAHPTYADSGLCAYQGISTAQQWLQHYQRVPSAGRRHAQCGFEVRNDLNWRAGPAFIQSLAAMPLLGNESFDTQNELRLSVWSDGSGASLPLEAFFYIAGGSEEA